MTQIYKYYIQQQIIKMKHSDSKHKFFQCEQYQLTHLKPEFDDFEERVKLNFNYQVLLNKSAIQVLNCQSNPQMMSTLKTKVDCTKIQKLNLSRCNIRNFNQFLPQIEDNYIKTQEQKSKVSFQLKFKNLKQLILQNNYIQKIPQNLQKFQSLLILKLNRNLIKFIPCLGNISHLQIKNNPIKELSTKVRQSRLTHFQMDWIDFIVQRSLNTGNQNSNASQNTRYFLDLIRSMPLLSQRKQSPNLITFFDVFQVKIKNKSEQYVKRIIAIFFNKALNTNFTLFFQYLKSLNNINFNQLKFNGKLILQKVLQQNYQYLVSLFMQKKSNLNSNDLYFQNLCLACRYSNLALFKYLMTMKTKKIILAQHKQFIRMQILYNFDKNLKSDQILAQILQNSSNKCRQIFLIPNDFTKNESLCIAQGMTYIISNDNLLKKFDFTSQRNFQNEQLYLQFAVQIKNMLLLKLLLFNVKVNPFLFNLYFKSARTSKGSLLGKKIIIKHQKKLINDSFLKSVSCNQLKTESKQKAETFFQNQSRAKDSQIITSIMQLQKHQPTSFLYKSHRQQLQVKQLLDIYLKLLQDKLFKEKDPIHLKKSNFKIGLQTQKKQKQQFNANRGKIKKKMLQKLQSIQQKNEVIGMGMFNSNLSKYTNKTKIKNQGIEYQLFHSLMLIQTDFVKAQQKQIQASVYIKQSAPGSFCNSQNYKQTHELQFQSTIKSKSCRQQQERTCGNIICFQVDQVHKDEYVYYHP